MILAILLSLLTATTYAAVSTTDRALVERGDNLLTNGGLESGKSSWTASAGTFAITTTAANVGKGLAAGSWDSSAASQTLTSTATVIPAGLYGRNGVASCLIQGASATHTMQAYDGTNIVGTQTITSSAAYARTSLNFIFPSSGNISLRLVSVAADEPIIYVDDCYIGPADTFNVSQVSQANFVGSAYFNSTASCTFTRTSTSLGAFSDTDCPGPTVETNPGLGTIQTTDVNAPVVTINSLPPGTYVVHFIGQSSIATSPQGNLLAISDGTTTGGIVAGPGNTVSGTQFHVVAPFFYTTSGNRSFELFGSSAANAVNIDLSAGNQRLYFYIERFPSSSEVGYRPDLINWKVDASISGASPSIGTANIATYTSITNGSLTLTNNTGQGNLTAQIPCSSTNPPTGTTCAVGTEDVGVSFTLPASQDVLACASFGNQIGNGAGGALSGTFQIMETPNNAQTINQVGKGRANFYFATASNNHTFPQRVCGVFTFLSAGQKTLRLMIEQAVSGTVNTHTINADALAIEGDRDIHWEVYPLNQSVPAPVLVGSVTSGTSGAERIERAQLNCDGSSSITTQSGNWITSIGNISSGVCSVTMPSGMWSTTYQCGVSYRTGSPPVTQHRTLYVYGITATTMDIGCAASSSGSATISACAGFDVDIICMGPKP